VAEHTRRRDATAQVELVAVAEIEVALVQVTRVTRSTYACSPFTRAPKQCDGQFRSWATNGLHVAHL
jgi:hypothetical protein